MRPPLLAAAVLTVALCLPAVASAEDLTIYSSLPLVVRKAPGSAVIRRSTTRPTSARTRSRDTRRRASRSTRSAPPGRWGNDRAAVVAAFHAIRDRDSVLGRYSIDANGDTTLSTYGVVAVGARGRLVYDRTVDSSR